MTSHLEREHTSRHYEQQLRTLKTKVLMMSHHAEKMIADSIQALIERRSSLAEEVIQNDATLDRFELEVDDLCYEILALEHPVAGDLRFLTTVLKIVRDLERIGDIAVNISRRVRELIVDPELQRLTLQRLTTLPLMADLALRMLTDSLDAFVNSDADLAEKMIRKDRLIDGMYEQILREMLVCMAEDPCYVSSGIKLIFIAKHLERVGDHSANILEMVVFLVRGQDIRHGAHPPRSAL